MIAEQIPAKLVPDAVKNTALKVLHRLPGRRRPAAGRRHDEPRRRSVPAGGVAAAGRGGGVRRRHGPADADPRPVWRRPRAGCRFRSRRRGRRQGRRHQRAGGGAAPAPEPAWRRRHPRNCRRWRAAGRPPAGTPAPRPLHAGRAPGRRPAGPVTAGRRGCASGPRSTCSPTWPTGRGRGCRCRCGSAGPAWTTGCATARWRPRSTGAVLGRGQALREQLRPGGPRRGLRDLGCRHSRGRQGRGHHAGHDLGHPAAAVAA